MPRRKSKANKEKKRVAFKREEENPKNAVPSDVGVVSSP